MRIHEIIQENSSLLTKAIQYGSKAIKPAAQTATAVVKQKQFMELLFKAAHIRSNLLVHIGQIAKNPADAAKLTDMFNTLKGPAINGMTWAQLVNQPATVLTNPKMASALVNNVKQTIEYVEAMIVKYGNPAHPNYKNKIDFLNQTKDLYRSVLAP